MSAATASTELSPAAERGRLIYHQGESASGTVLRARVGEQDIELPASTLPCASCHGPDGLGRPESGVYPSRITWDYLAHPAGHQHEKVGRRHGPFDQHSFGVALAEGIDPSGNRLDPLMPRYSLDDDQLADLVAYLGEIGGDRDPGVGAEWLQVAAVLPRTGALAPLGRSVEALLRARLDQVNAAGGVHGRQIHLVVADGGQSGPDALAAARRLALGNEVFALLSVFAPGAETGLAELARETGVPVIAPLAVRSPPAQGLLGPVYFIYPDNVSLAGALLRHAADDPEHPDARTVLVWRDGLVPRQLLPLAGRDRTGSPAVLSPGDRAGIEGLRGELEATDAMFVLYAADAASFSAFHQQLGEAAARARWLLPGPLAEAAWPVLSPAERAQARVGVHSVPGDIQGRRGQQFQALVAELGLEQGHLPAQVLAFAGLELLIEGARLGGRRLTREGFVAALDELAAFDTGVTPPLSFRGNRRIGAAGAYVLQPQGGLGHYQQLGGWVHAVH